jgi:nicotinamidase-related amidase
VTIAGFDIDTTALVLIDISKGFLRLPVFGNDGEVVLANAVALARAFRDRDCMVVLTRNAGRPGGADVQAKGAALVGDPMPVERERLKIVVSAVASQPDFSELPDELGPEPTDYLLSKHSWGAFIGTDLDLQLRRVGVRSIVIGGIATNFGVESTAREARSLGYNLVFVRDVMRALTAEEHDHSVKYTFPMMGQVATTDDVLAAIEGESG